jgi:hypothetical protein
MLSSKTTWLISLATATLLVSMGCDGSATSSTLNNDSNGTTPTTNNQNPNAETPNSTTLMNNSVGEVEDNTEDIPAPDNPNLGEEPGQDLIPVGYLNGIWRVATSDINDVPVVYLSVVHDEGAATATCDYEMSIGPTDPDPEANGAPLFQLDGRVGRCISATWENDQLVAKFAPTPDSADVWTVATSTKADANTMTGTLTRQKDSSYSLSVNLERQVPDPNDDGVRPAYNGQ